MNLTTIYSSNVPVDCHILKGRLETDGIDVFIYDENIVWVNPFKAVAVGGVKLKVPADQLENASRILEGIAHNKLIDVDGEYELAEAFEKSMQRQKETLPVEEQEYHQDKELLDLHTNASPARLIAKCPACKSENVSFGYAIDNRWCMLHFIFSVLIMAPLPLFRKNYHCFDCGADFRPVK